MSEEPLILYEVPAPGVARLVQNRPAKRNAQDSRFLYALNDAFDRASLDDAIKIIVLSARGPHFSAGHDTEEGLDVTGGPQLSPWGGYDLPGVEGLISKEEELYTTLCWRWRNLPKPTIAQVHGKVIAGGLMIVWPCDLIVCSEDSTFADPTLALGLNGVEYFAHDWELGPRKAKEMLFTGEAINAADAHRLGMVNHVVPAEELESFTLDLAVRIARMPTMALKLAKLTVNQSLDIRGQWSSLRAAMGLHYTARGHNLAVHDRYSDASGYDRMRGLSSDPGDPSGDPPSDGNR